MDYKILIVDDHCLVRSGLKPILDDALNGKCQVLEAETLEGTLEVIDRHQDDLDLVLLDLTLPDAQGLTALDRVRERFPSVPLAVLSMACQWACSCLHLISRKVACSTSPTSIS